MSVVRFGPRREHPSRRHQAGRAFLDEDVQTESLAEAEKNRSMTYSPSSNGCKTTRLPSLDARDRCLRTAVEAGFCKARSARISQTIAFTDVARDRVRALTGGASRKEAKRQLDELINHVAKLRVWDYQRSLDSLAQFFSKTADDGTVDQGCALKKLRRSCGVKAVAMPNPSAGIGDPYWYEWSVGLTHIIELLNPDSGVETVTLHRIHAVASSHFMK